jgi:hypothetical protein
MDVNIGIVTTRHFPRYSATATTAPLLVLLLTYNPRPACGRGSAVCCPLSFGLRFNSTLDFLTVPISRNCEFMRCPAPCRLHTNGSGRCSDWKERRRYLVTRGCKSILVTGYRMLQAVFQLKPRQLNEIFLRFLGFHGSDYDECRLLGCDAVWLL